MGYVRKAASARRRKKPSLARPVPPGSQSRACAHWGPSRNLGDPVVSTPESRKGATGTENPWSVGSAAWPVGSGERPVHESIAAGVVPPSEGNEARRDGRPGIGASHSTVEAGELTPEDPVKGRGCRMTEPLE